MRRGEVMARVYPTQVVAFIERMFPGGMEQPPEKIRGLAIRSHVTPSSFAALIEMAQTKSPPELNACRSFKNISSLMASKAANIAELSKLGAREEGVSDRQTYISACGRPASPLCPR